MGGSCYEEAGRRYWLYEASITDLDCLETGALSLKIEDVGYRDERSGKDEDGQSARLFVTVEAVDELLRDGERIDRIEMLGQDGDIFAFDIKGGSLSMLVTWIDYPTRTETTHEYVIKGSRIVVKPEIPR